MLLLRSLMRARRAMRVLSLYRTRSRVIDAPRLPRAIGIVRYRPEGGRPGTSKDREWRVRDEDSGVLRSDSRPA